MLASVRALLSGIIDYAGMFPPAKLPLDEAIRNYARYRTEPESWMLGRFVCPAARLEELEPYLSELFGIGPFLTVSALGQNVETIPEFLASLRADLDTIGSFQKRHCSRVIVDGYEIRLPGELFRQEKKILDQAVMVAEIAQNCQVLEASGFGVLAYYESPLGQGLELVLEGLTSSLIPLAGIKIRCGGLNASAVPSS